MRLHNWASDDPSVFEQVYGNLVEETGAVIMGRRSYDNSIEAWGGKVPLGDVPCFVVTHTPPAALDPLFTFVTDGIASALAKAPGGRRRQADRTDGREHRPAIPRVRLVDEIRIHVVDVLLGGGRRLFDELLQRIRAGTDRAQQDRRRTHPSTTSSGSTSSRRRGGRATFPALAGAGTVPESAERDAAGRPVREHHRADQAAARHRAPHAGVAGVGAVVAEDEVVTWRNARPLVGLVSSQRSDRRRARRDGRRRCR